MSCFYQQIHKQGVGLQEDLEQGAQNSRGLGLKLKDQVQTSCCTEVKGIRGVGCSLGKHQVKRTSMVTDGQCVGTAETLISEGITKKETRDPREARWGERSKERRDQGRGRGAGMRAARPQRRPSAESSPPPHLLTLPWTICKPCRCSTARSSPEQMLARCGQRRGSAPPCGKENRAAGEGRNNHTYAFLKSQ